MRRYRAGERPKAIFESAGLRESLIGCKRIERACAHWREAEAKDALCLTHEEVSELVDEYIDYYNNERGQERLGWLTPKEYAATLAA